MADRIPSWSGQDLVLTTTVVQHCVASWPVVQEVEEDRRSRRRWRGRVEGGRRDEAQHIDQELPSSPPLPNKAPTMLLLLVSMACQVPRTTSRSGSGSAQATKNHHLLPLAPSNAYPRSDAHLHGGNGCGGTMEAKASILRRLRVPVPTVTNCVRGIVA